MSFVPMPVETFSQSVKEISFEHSRIHAGESFRYFDSLTLASGVSQDYWIQTPATPRMHLNFDIDGTAVTSFFLYEDTDKLGVSTQTIHNAFRGSATVSGATIKKGLSGGTTDGALLFSRASGTATVQSRSAATVSHNNEWVLKPNAKYIFRITSGTAGNLCNIALDWYEHVSGT